MKFRARSMVVLATFIMAFTMVSIDFAEARRGGSFGSRGTRTFQAAPPTRTAPAPTAPVERSMQPAAQQPANAARPNATAQRPAFGGFGGAMMRGLMIGGIFGLLMGYGFGGLAGAMGMLLQLLLIGGVAFLLLRLFRSRAQPAYATAGAGAARAASGAQPRPPMHREASEPQKSSFTIPRVGGGAAAGASRDLKPTPADLDTFERLLSDVQEAFTHQDHAALRRFATPEMVSYFSEELAENAMKGVRNEVTGVRLLQADIAEAWQEGDTAYATAAFEYESRDVMRDQKTGEIVGGADEPTETTELWTFVRARGDNWKLSAIQDARQP